MGKLSQAYSYPIWEVRLLGLIVSINGHLIDIEICEEYSHEVKCEVICWEYRPDTNLHKDALLHHIYIHVEHYICTHIECENYDVNVMIMVECDDYGGV